VERCQAGACLDDPRGLGARADSSGILATRQTAPQAWQRRRVGRRKSAGRSPRARRAAVAAGRGAIARRGRMRCLGPVPRWAVGAPHDVEVNREFVATARAVRLSCHVRHSNSPPGLSGAFAPVKSHLLPARKHIRNGFRGVDGRQPFECFPPPSAATPRRSLAGNRCLTRLNVRRSATIGLDVFALANFCTTRRWYSPCCTQARVSCPGGDLLGFYLPGRAGRSLAARSAPCPSARTDRRTDTLSIERESVCVSAAACADSPSGVSGYCVRLIASSPEDQRCRQGSQ
jgi:hypothetical protein